MPLSRDSVESLIITHPIRCVIFSVLEKLKNLFNVAQTLDQERRAVRLPTN